MLVLVGISVLTAAIALGFMNQHTEAGPSR